MIFQKWCEWQIEADLEGWWTRRVNKWLDGTESPRDRLMHDIIMCNMM